MPAVGSLFATHDPQAVAKTLVPPVQPITGVLHAYAELFKLRVTTMLGASAWCGASLAAHTYSPARSSSILVPIAAITAVAAGCAALNEIAEREIDSKMYRTADRPLVTGRISVLNAVIISLLMTVLPTAYLAFRTNWVTGVLTLFTAITYLGIYTPLKKTTTHCTTIGAVPGAMPVVLGWTAVRGSLDLECLALFALVFFWQFPHFYAIALLYRDDYRRAGIRMLPVVHCDATSTVRLMWMLTIVLIPLSLILGIFQTHPIAYVSIATILGGGLLGSTLTLSRQHARQPANAMKSGARRVLLASIVYLVCLFPALVLTQ